ncbi:MAG: Ig-like domain-containing protein [Quisquiliibacterium sp.]
MSRNFLTRIFTRLAMMSLIAMASGCGGGAGSGFGLEGYVIAKTVELYTSAQTLDPSTEETKSVTVTAIIKDAQNRVMAGQQVVFSASSGVSVGKVKDADGKETDLLIHQPN